MSSITASMTQVSGDQVLVDAFKGGNERAFAELMHRYRERVYSIVFRFLHNPQDAEEITQDAFIRAHKGLFDFRGDCAFFTWLVRIAENLARNRYWFWQRRMRDQHFCIDIPLGVGTSLTLADVIPSGQDDPAYVAEKDEFIQAISSAMNQLEPHHCQILTLRNGKQLSYEEIAQELALNVGTVKSRIARARTVLYTILKSKGLADTIRRRVSH